MASQVGQNYQTIKSSMARQNITPFLTFYLFMLDFHLSMLDIYLSVVDILSVHA
jgi:hypothetical protein